jgi:pimeloyl-ACP methyl ester carboxylesterase
VRIKFEDFSSNTMIFFTSFLLAVLALTPLSVCSASQYDLVEITPEVRTQLGGDYVQLESGTISYYLKGSESGEVVFLVHGAITPKYVFDHNVDALTAAGFRVLAFDQYGRGYSDRPDVVYDKNFYDQVLINLLEALKIKKPVNILGYSMGGGIATVFTARHPKYVKKLALIAPIGIPDIKSRLRSFMTLFLRIPGAGNGLRSRILTSLQDKVERRIATPRMLELGKEQFKFKGTTDAMISTLTNYPMVNLKQDYIAAGKLKIPKILFWGNEDVSFPKSKEVIEAMPGIQFIPIEGAGHSVVYSKADVINAELIKFLKN